MSSNENVASLAPCPFCGQQDAFVEQLDSDASVVICQGRVGEHSACLARGPVGIQEDENETQPGHDAAVREWNRQSSKSAEQHLVERAAAWRHGADLNFNLLQIAERSCSLLEDWVQATNAGDSSLTEQIKKTRALLESHQPTWSSAVRDLIQERRRQVHEEGWSSDHDDLEVQGGLASAAATYALKAIGMTDYEYETWPWGHEYLKPGEPRRMLVKAGALILAELDRLDRQAARKARSNAKGTAQ